MILKGNRNPWSGAIPKGESPVRKAKVSKSTQKIMATIKGKLPVACCCCKTMLLSTQWQFQKVLCETAISQKLTIYLIVPIWPHVTIFYFQFSKKTFAGENLRPMMSCSPVFWSILGETSTVFS
jgi:hypothetical protein